jgi:hypothetical protein
VLLLLLLLLLRARAPTTDVRTYCADQGKPETRPSHRAASALPPLTRMLPSFQTPSTVSSERAARGVWVWVGGCRVQVQVQVPSPSGALQRPRAANGPPMARQ